MRPTSWGFQKPRRFISSSDDTATYAVWRRGVLILYGGIVLIAIAAVVANQFAGVWVDMAGK